MTSRLPWCLLPLALLGPVYSAPSENSSAPMPVPTQSYTDQGSITRQVTSDYSGGYYSNYGSGSMYGSNYISGTSYSTVTTYYKMLVAPPVPPALGEPIPSKKVQASLAKFSPPSMLASFVYEPFFTPLSPLLFSEDLSKARREKLTAYTTARAAAVEALRAKIDSLLAATPEVRQSELSEFARVQTPTLVELENMAEEMRANYVDGRWYETSSNWNSTRNWRLGDNTRWESNIDEIKVALGSAFFQEGLSPAQRRLLRELAMELTDSLKQPTDEIALGTPGPFFYFTPETARIRLPVDMPAELESKIRSYQDEKAALKLELREALYRQDRAFFEFTRVKALKALAEQQAARLARVETLAEEIRQGLALLPNPARPAGIPLRGDATGLISRYLAAKSSWQRAMLAKREKLRNDFPEDRVEFIRLRDTVAIQLVANRRSSDAVKAQRDVALADLEAFNATQSKGYQALARDKEKINSELVSLAKSLASHGGGKSVELLLTEFAYALRQQERWDQFAEYDTAVLQPGLSPEQRRLLFGAALERMELPFGEKF
ncbi:MAG: hypothetical protein RL091_1549 [Verrucomicrobiota bacterium]